MTPTPPSHTDNTVTRHRELNKQVNDTGWILWSPHCTTLATPSVSRLHICL